MFLTTTKKQKTKRTENQVKSRGNQCFKIEICIQNGAFSILSHLTVTVCYKRVMFSSLQGKKTEANKEYVKYLQLFACKLCQVENTLKNSVRLAGLEPATF